ncbi:uncharacterized protein [Ptychodera flava]|uniref:uncharacterized protein isoform X1 n=1 Tax=Ptychodera flava TaxID=63121 RepID=UPI00396A3621
MKQITVARRNPSVDTSTKTIRERARLINSTRKVVSRSKSDTRQVQRELKLLRPQDRSAILQPYLPDVPDIGGLILKTNIGLSWNGLRKLRRWLRNWKIKLRSEHRDRDEASKLKNSLSAQKLPFQFLVKGPNREQSREIRLAPCVAVKDLKIAVINRLECLEREEQLYWHNGVIPANEIWLKIDGDKGGGTVKTVFQICNTVAINSVENTII